MLKNIPPILSPELLKVLCEMGHSDRIVIADGNFPAESKGRNAIVIRCDGHGTAALLDALLQLFPLDTYTDYPVTLMQKDPGDPIEIPVWEEYGRIIEKYDERGTKATAYIKRTEFYRQAQEAYAIIATGEKALYANLILQKGVV
jgi:L-fucose mutarotase